MVIGAINLLWGFTLRNMREKLEKRLLAWLINKEENRTGIELMDVE